MSLELVGYGDEVVGADDVSAEVADILSGVGDDELVGAVGPRRRGVRLRRKAPTRVRRLYLPLGSTSIGVGATVTITSNPQHPFKAERMILFPSAVGLLITNLQIGTDSQFVAAGSMPVELFAAANEDATFNADTARPGVEIAMTVNNPTAGAITLGGGILGTVVRF